MYTYTNSHDYMSPFLNLKTDWQETKKVNKLYNMSHLTLIIYILSDNATSSTESNPRYATSLHPRSSKKLYNVNAERFFFLCFYHCMNFYRVCNHRFSLKNLNFKRYLYATFTEIVLMNLTLLSIKLQ